VGGVRQVGGHEPSEVTERSFKTGPEPEVVIESGRGPDEPTIVAALVSPARKPALNSQGVFGEP
jgi:hypothetical protein